MIKYILINSFNILSSFLNIYRFDFVISILIICLIKKIKVIKKLYIYIFKLYCVINYLIFNIYINYKFYFK
jgi:hypothetical protein